MESGTPHESGRCGPDSHLEVGRVLIVQWFCTMCQKKFEQMLDHPDVKRFVDQLLPWLRNEWASCMSTPVVMGPSYTETVADPVS